MKALAYFRGAPAVSLDDARQMAPFVLHDKLAPNLQAPFFDVPENAALRVDRVSWIRELFDLSCREYDRLDLDREDPVAAFDAEFSKGLEGVSEQETRNRLTKIERALSTMSKAGKLYGHLFDDILKLKYLHQRYSNYLWWLKWRG